MVDKFVLVWYFKECKDLNYSLAGSDRLLSSRGAADCFTLTEIQCEQPACILWPGDQAHCSR